MTYGHPTLEPYGNSKNRIHHDLADTARLGNKNEPSSLYLIIVTSYYGYLLQLTLLCNSRIPKKS